MAIPVALAIGAMSGLGNFAANSSANDRAQAIYNEQFKRWMAINIPDPKDQEIVLQKFVLEGKIDPILEGAIAADPSAFESIQTDAGLKGSQVRALSELEDIGYSGGMRLQDEAALQEGMLGAQTRDRANREGILDEMSRRGTRGGGSELAARLKGQQDVADRDSQNSLKVAAMSQDRALQSIMGAGDLAGKLRGQDFNEQAQKASASDTINRFNTENLRDVTSRNTASLNRGNEMNLANQQRISDQNVGLTNQQNIHNKGLIQQQYDNQLKKMAGATGQAASMAQTAQRGGELTGNTISNIGGAASNAIIQDDFWDKYFKAQKGK